MAQFIHFVNPLWIKLSSALKYGAFLVLALWSVPYYGLSQSLDTISICTGDEIQLVARDSFASTIWGPLSEVPPNSIQRAVTLSPSVSTMFFVELVPPTGPNRIRNFDFDTLLANFTSDYSYTSTGPLVPGSFTVTSTPSNFNPDFRNCRDVNRNGGPERMMLISSSGNPNETIYRQQVDVEPNKRYRIALFSTSLSPEIPQLEIRLNGQVSGDFLVPDLATCNWKQYLFSWNSGNSSTLELAILNRSTLIDVPFLLDGIIIVEQFPSIFDSTYIVVNQRDTTLKSIGLCEGERYVRNGLNLGPEQSGFYRVPNSPDCDSIIKVSTFQYSFPVDTNWIDACEGEVVNLRGFDYTSSTIVCYTATSLTGCDSMVCDGIRFFDSQAVTSFIIPADCEIPNSASITINATGVGPFRYSWSDFAIDTAVRTNLTDGTYSFTVENANGCSFSDSITLLNAPPLTWTEVPSALYNCSSLSSAFAKTSGGEGDISFSFRQNNTPLNFEELTSGEITLYATDERGCSIDTTLLVEFIEPSSFAIAGPNEVSLREGTYSVTGNLSSNDTITWSFGESLTTAQSSILQRLPASIALQYLAPASGWLFAILELQEGCAIKDSLYIEFKEPIKSFFPSAFSPNGDGTNDVFGLVRDTSVLLIESIRIFSRWGELMFEQENCLASQAQLCAWNGRSQKGSIVNSGVYLYAARLRLKSGKTVDVAGDVTLFAELR